MATENSGLWKWGNEVLNCRGYSYKCKHSLNKNEKLHIHVQLFAIFEGIVKGLFRTGQKITGSAHCSFHHWNQRRS